MPDRRAENRPDVATGRMRNAGLTPFAGAVPLVVLGVSPLLFVLGVSPLPVLRVPERHAVVQAAQSRQIS